MERLVPCSPYRAMAKLTKINPKTSILNFSYKCKKCVKPVALKVSHKVVDGQQKVCLKFVYEQEQVDNDYNKKLRNFLKEEFSTQLDKVEYRVIYAMSAIMAPDAGYVDYWRAVKDVFEQYCDELFDLCKKVNIPYKNKAYFSYWIAAMEDIMTYFHNNQGSVKTDLMINCESGDCSTYKKYVNQKNMGETSCRKKCGDKWVVERMSGGSVPNKFHTTKDDVIQKKKDKLRSIQKKESSDKRSGVWSEGLFDFKVTLGGLEEAASKLADVNVNHNIKVDIVKSSIEAVTGALSSFGDLVKQSATGFYSTVFLFLQHVAKVILYCFLATKAFFRNIPKVLINMLFPEDFFDVLSMEEDTVSSEISLGSVKTICQVVAGCVFYHTIPKTNVRTLVSEFLKRSTDLSKNISGMESVIVLVASLVERAVNFVAQKFGFEEIKILETGKKEMDVWVDAVTAMHEALKTGDHVSLEKLPQIKSLVKQANELMKMYRSNPQVMMALQPAFRKMESLISAYTTALHINAGARVEPACFALQGGAGIGKSTLLKWLSHSLLASVLPIDRLKIMGNNLGSEVFVKGASEYWNGYTGQYICQFDDMLQSVPVAGTENEAEIIIRVVNGMPYPLNFADVESKGTEWFRSKVVLITTNVTDLQRVTEKVINCPAALERRLKNTWVPHVKPEFRIEGTEKLDGTKMPEVYNPSMIWYFRKYDWTQKKEVGLNLTFEEVLSDMVREYKQMQNDFVTSTKLINSFTDDLIRSRVQSEMGDDEFFDAGEHFGVSCVFSKCAVAASNALNYAKEWDTRYPMLKWLLVSLPVLVLLIRGIASYFRSKSEKVNRLNIRNEYPLAMRTELVVKNGLLTKERVFDVELYKEHYGSQAGSSSRLFGKTYISKDDVYEAFEDRTISEMDTMGLNVGRLAATNTWVLYDGDTRTRFGHVQGVTGNWYLCPWHFARSLKDKVEKGEKTLDSPLYLRNANGTASVTIPYSVMINAERSEIFETQDIMLFQIKNLPNCKDITKFFIKEADLQVAALKDVRLETAEDFEDRFVYRVRLSRGFYLTGGINARLGELEPSQIKKYVKYSCLTRPGDCGGLLFLDECAFMAARRIMGVHSAGDGKGTAFAAVLTQERLTEALKKVGAIREVDPFEVDVLIESECTHGANVSMGSFRGIGKCVRVVSSPTESKLRHTKFFGCWGDTRYAPALLRAKGAINPMENALKNYSTPTQYMNQDKVDFARDAVFEYIYPTIHSHDKPVLTKEQAVSDSVYGNIPRDTSPGYPFSFYTKPGSGKKEFFGEDGDYVFTSEKCKDLFKRVDTIVQNAKEGVRSWNVFSDFLKDERRPFAKVEAGKTRLISAAPLDYVVAVRMYFQAFVTALEARGSRIHNGVAIGVDHHSFDWDTCVMHLQTKGTRVLAGDYSAFDSSEQPQIHEAVLDIINRWYDDGEENARVRYVLWQDLMFSRHINYDTFVQWSHSLPSGHPLTSIVNSIYNMINLVLCYGSFIGNHTRCREFFQECSPLVYGDDNVVNVSDKVSLGFNQNTIGQYMQEFGMTYTNEDKAGEMADYRKITEVSFLKRRFRFEPLRNRFVGPLCIESIKEMPYWSHNPQIVDEVALVNLETALMELSAHDDEEFFSLAPKMADAKMRLFGVATKFSVSTRKGYLAEYDNTVDPFSH